MLAEFTEKVLLYPAISGIVQFQAVSNDGFETKIALFIAAYATTFLNWQVKLFYLFSKICYN